MKNISVAVLAAFLIAFTNSASLSDYDTVIDGDTLDGRYVHFQSLKYPERWVRGYYSSTSNLKVKTFTEREVYDNSVTQWKVKHLGNNVLVFEFMRRESRYIRIRTNDKDLERSETAYPDDKDWAKWKILCTDSSMDDCVIQSQKYTDKYFNADSSEKLQRSGFSDPRSRFRVLAPTPSDTYESIWSTINAGSVDQTKTLTMYEGISETLSSSSTITASVTAEVEAAFGSGSTTLAYEWSTSTSTTWSSHTSITYSVVVPAGKKIDIKQLIGTYGPFSVRSAHFYIEETDATKKDPTVRRLSKDEKSAAFMKKLEKDVVEDVMEELGI